MDVYPLGRRLGSTHYFGSLCLMGFDILTKLACTTNSIHLVISVGLLAVDSVRAAKSPP